MKFSRDKDNFHHLHEAYISFKKKNYTNAIIILDQSRDYGRDDCYAHFLQAVCLLYSNNFSAANVYMEMIQRINPAYTPFIQLKSFLALKSSANREAALAAYISALEKNSSDRLLRKGLRAVEKSADFHRYQKGAKLSDLVYVPRPGKKRIFSQGFNLSRRGKNIETEVAGFAIKPLFAGLLLLIAVSAAAGIALFRSGWVFDSAVKGNVVKLSGESISRIDMVDITGSGYGIINRINKDKTPEFYTSGDMLTNDFNDARLLVKKGMFNKAVVILNRIANSNASFPVKEKSDFLIRFIMESEDRVYDEIDLKQINEKPYLYRGSAVKFSGKAANVKELKGGKAFSVMVGFDGNNFKGICDVYDPQKGNADNGDIVEIEGMFILNIGGGGAPYISADKVRIISKNSR